MNHWQMSGAMMILGVAVTSAAPENHSAGKKLYTGKCASCHKLYSPAKYDDKTWDAWMQKMRQKAKLNDVQYRQLADYLATLQNKQ